MNERILELADKAIEDMPGAWNIPDEFCKKFAELIVQECISVMKSTVDESIDFERKLDETSYWIESDIKKHFGVEEQEKVAPKPRCSVCGTTENVKYMGGYQPYLCESVDCIPF